MQADGIKWLFTLCLVSSCGKDISRVPFEASEYEVEDSRRTKRPASITVRYSSQGGSARAISRHKGADVRVLARGQLELVTGGESVHNVSSVSFQMLDVVY